MKLNNEIKNTNPFKVPEGYFETLTDRTMSAINESRHEDMSVAGEEKPARKIRLRPYLALAAAITGFALIATFMVRLIRNDNVAKIQSEEYSLYADLAAEELDIYMLENELRNMEQGEDAFWYEEEILENEVSTDAIIDYLTTEDIDINDIYELF